jgi:hypothetical protein
LPQLFEIFGYPLADASGEAQRHRKQALCPFMGMDCDGGGNRYLSSVNTDGKPGLERFFGKKGVVPAGVCSIQLHPNQAPWIVCPRRLLTFKVGAVKTTPRQLTIQQDVLKLLQLPPGTPIGVWPEVKLQYKERVGKTLKSFDYTFDYILFPIADVNVERIEHEIEKPWSHIRGLFKRGGYEIIKRDGAEVVRECPSGAPHIVEIMTSSTSGGNKAKRTTIPMAFEDAILEKSHEAPGINYRQVWARMVSQLVVKSEVALSWGGRAIWVVQDALSDYIKATTGLELDKLRANSPSEVNMLAFSYGERFKNASGVIELRDSTLFAGPIASKPDGKRRRPAFQDMIRAPVCPPLGALLLSLSGRRAAYTLTAP